MICEMKDGAVVVDVAIDQGGCFETSHATTHADPVYVVDGVIHYCVANMPGGVPITSTKALTNATLPVRRGDRGHGPAARPSRPIPALAKGVNVLARQGHLRGRRRGARARVHAARRRPAAQRGLGRFAAASALAALAFFFAGERAELHDEPCDARRERDHADDEDHEADQSEDVGAHGRRIAACRVRA